LDASCAEVDLTMAMTTEQVASALERRIAEGTYLPGEFAPSISDISAEFGVAPGTARRALALLDTRGLTVGGGQGRLRRVASSDSSSSFTSAIDRIRANIASGEYPAGTQLPSEVQLSVSTGLSRYAIREAFAELERSGEVINRPGRRRTVAGGRQPTDARYEQIKAAISDDVEHGRLVSGQRLGSEAELVERFAMSRVTVRRALADLENEGVLSRDEAGRRIIA
jgi:DNA-binding GntR family transcriptional regulator